MQHNSRLFIEKQLDEEKLFVVAESYALDSLLSQLDSLHPDHALLLPATTEGLCGVAIGLALSGKKVLLQLHDTSALAELNSQLQAAHFGSEFPLPILIRIPISPSDRPTSLIDSHPRLTAWVGGGSLVEQLLSSGITKPTVLFELPDSSLQESETVKSVELQTEGEHLSIYTSMLNRQEAVEALHLLRSEGVTADLIVLNQMSDISASAQLLMGQSCNKTGRPIFVDIPQALVANLYDKSFWRLESKPVHLSKVTSARIYQAAQEIIL